MINEKRLKELDQEFNINNLQDTKEVYKLAKKVGIGEVKDLYSFRQYSSYSNFYLPNLREVAGYKKGEVGTYQVIPNNKSSLDLELKLDDLVKLFNFFISNKRSVN